MMYIRNPNPDRTWEAYLENALSTEALQYVEQYVKDNPTQSAGTQNHGDDQDIRKSDITWININEDAQKNLYGEVHQLVERVNQGKYNFQISSIEPIQYSEYTDGGHYTWHTDATLKGEQNDTRKISFSILLNDDFEGGELELYKFGDKPDTMKMKKNSILFFPSFILHRVTPVTSGTRKALVGWVHGPNFV